MANPNEFIKGLQQRPYEERLKILWLSVFVIGLVVVGGWIALMKVENISSTSNGDSNFFTIIKEGFKKTGDELKNPSLSGTPTTTPIITEDQTDSSLTIKDYNIDQQQGLLTINFEVKNSSQDILNFLNSARNNFILLDEQVKITPQKLVTTKQDPFPIKILSGQEVSGIAVFSIPQNQKTTLVASDVYFENSPQNKFNQSADLDFDAEVKGALIRLPRE